MGLGPFNDWMYRVRSRVFRRILRPLGAQIKGARVLDVGSGTGFYLERWEQLGAQEIWGLDISAVAVERLATRFPRAQLRCLDVTQATPLSAMCELHSWR